MSTCQTILHGVGCADHQGTPQGLTDEELVEQIKENPFLQFCIGLEAFQYSSAFGLSMMVYSESGCQNPSSMTVTSEF